MGVVRLIARLVGLFALLMGLLWVGQGTGLIMWPQESFMLADHQWAINGAILAAAGVLLLWLAGRKRQL